jgi:class 3 adenylate cyclase
MDYAAIGNVTNLTARLCAIAKGGEMLTSQRTLAKVEHLVDVEAKGEVEVKGIKRPVKVYNILGLKDASLE